MEIINNKYKIIKYVNATNYAKEYLVKDLETEEIYFMNIYEKNLNLNFIEKFSELFVVFQNINHPYILKDVDFGVIENIENLRFFHVYQYLDRKKLLDYKTLSFNDRVKVIEKTIYAVRYLNFKKQPYTYINFRNINIYKDKDGKIQVKLQNMLSVFENINIFYNEEKKDRDFLLYKIENGIITSDNYNLCKVIYYLITGKDQLKDKIDLKKDIKENYKNLYEVLFNNLVSDYFFESSFSEIVNALNVDLGISVNFFDKEYYEKINKKVKLIDDEDNLGKCENFIINFFNQMSDNNVICVRSSIGSGKTVFLKKLKEKLLLKGLNVFYIDGFLNNSKEKNNYFKDLDYALKKKFQFLKDEKYSKDSLELIVDLALKNNFVIIFDDVDKMQEDEIYTLYKLMNLSTRKRPFLIVALNDAPVDYYHDKLRLNPNVIEIESFNHHKSVKYIEELLDIESKSAKILSRKIYPVTHGNPKNIRSVIENLVENKYIYVDESRKLKSKEFDLKVINNEKEFENVNFIVNTFYDGGKAIAKFFSVYAYKFDENLIKKFLNLSDETIKKSLNEMLNKRILRMILQNNKIYYEFYNYEVLGLIYINLKKEEKLNYHLILKDYYEQFNKLTDQEFDSYIYHLIESYNVKLAVLKIIERAKEKYNQSKYYEALEYIDYGKNLEKELNEKKLKLMILQEESYCVMEIGSKNQLKEIYKKIINLSKDNQNYYSYMIYALIGICSLELSIRNFQGYENYKIELLNILDKNGFKDDVNSTNKYSLDILKLKFYFEKGKNDILLQEALNLKEALKKEDLSNANIKRYTNTALYYVTVGYFLKNDLKKGFLVFKYLKNILNVNDNPKELITLNNLIGQVYLYKIKDFKTAERFFETAIKISDTKNINLQDGNVYFNLARCKKFLLKYEEAFQYYLIGEYISFKSMDFYLLIDILNDLIEFLMNNGKYELAENKFIVFEKILSQNLSYFSLEKYYFNLILKARFLINCSFYKEARIIVNRINKEGIKYLNSSMKGNLYLIKFLLDYSSFTNMNQEFSSKYISLIKDLEIDDYSKSIINLIFIRISIHAYCLGRKDIFSNILEAINYDKVKKESKLIENIKITEFVDIIKDNVNISEMKNLLFKYDNLNNIFFYKLYYIIGNIEFENKNYEKAIFYIYEAYDRYKDILNNMSESCKKESQKRNLVYNEIVNKLKILRSKLSKLLVRKEVLNSIFSNNEKLKEELLENKSVENIFRTYYIKNNEKSTENYKEYINSLSENFSENLKNLLYLFMNITLATKGYLVLVDEDKKATKGISESDEKIPEYVYNSIKNINVKNDYILIEKNKKNDFYLGYKKNNITNVEKSALVFPIALDKVSPLSRNEGLLEINENILAYCYLESSMFLNKIDLNSLNKIKSYENLNALIVNNYNMYVRSNIDKLTGIFIRNVAEKKVDSVVKKMKNKNYTFAVLMMDIDKFKNVNDTYGHQKGDEVLRKIGKILKANLRKEDVAARYGGEEFIVVLLNQDEKGGLIVAEKLRKKIEDSKLLGQDKSLTISIGVSVYPRDGENFAQIVESADKALYSSKETGRNKVTLYSESMKKVNKNISIFSGLFSTDASENAIKITAIMEILGLLKIKMDKYEKLNLALSKVLDVINGKDLFILTKDKDIFVNKYIENEDNSLDEDFRNYIVNSKECGCFSNNKINGKKGSYAFCKIVKNGKEYGTIFSRNFEEDEYSYKDYNFITSVAPVFASILEE